MSISLTKPTVGSTGWGSSVNQNWTDIENAINGLTPATQAEMEAASSTAVYVSPGRTLYHPGVAKAWVYFQGTGTVTIKSSYGVSSITDNGTGQWTVNLSTSFSSADYCAVLGGPSPTVLIPQLLRYTTKTASACQLLGRDSSNNNSDLVEIYVAFFGDL